ncbi:prolipoprotein diacylglyceryl transferase [Robbsia sp. KACC 23696]|uniref:prolipoprotein diacylglyceryl transferase n=1 Tax=Robbsia sp. KACC 23696 TaxID=3149231 RepID=UPI00325B4943
MLLHPDFNPIAIQLGPLAIRWYGLMYLLAFVLGVTVLRMRLKQPQIAAQGWDKRDIDDILFYAVLGVILGGRIGYILFYKADYYFANPAAIFRVWEGGMSFHGGFLGVALAMWLFSRSRKRPLLQVTDYLAPAVPLGLAAGRFGNFINGELWGRVTSPSLPWGMMFPQAAGEDRQWMLTHAAEAAAKGLTAIYPIHGLLPRHPSELYEMALEGFVLFFVMWLFARKPRPMGAVTGLFIVGYGIARFVVEMTRQPDDFLGLLALGLSMGQWLSLPMILIGIGMIVWAFKRRPVSAPESPSAV